MYNIVISYIAGDSFGYSDEIETEILGRWHDINIVKENLQRIKDHYTWYTCTCSGILSNKEIEAARPQWHKEKFQKCDTLKLSLIMDIGEKKEQEYVAHWIGYFTKFISAEIIDPSLKFTV